MGTTFKSMTRSKARSKQSPQPWKPLPYMKKAVKFGLENAAVAFLLDPGLGKTAITLAILLMLKKAGLLNAAFVVTTLRPMRLVWPEELKKWADFAGLSLGVLHGPNMERVLAEEHDLYITNYESLPKFFSRTPKPPRKYFLTPLGKLLLQKCNVLVWDELSKMKNTQATRFKLVAPWLKKFDRRYGLTGSFASNGLLDLFGQCYVLDEGNALGQYVTHYRERYFISNDKQGFSWRIKHGAEEDIYDAVAPLALRMSAEDHLKLPPVRTFPIRLDLPETLRARYKELEDDLLTVLDGDVFTAKNAAAGNNLCRQFCSGAIYKAEIDFLTGIKKAGPREWVELHDAKLEAAEDLLEELNGQQVLIAYEYKHDIERLAARLGPKLHRFGQGDKKDKWLQDAWNAGEVLWAAGHPDSIGHGLNLQDSAAHNVLWFTLTWNFELYDQFIRRLKRQGNKAAFINNYQLIMRDTVEESVAALLKAKDRTQAQLYDALKLRLRLEDVEDGELPF